MRNGTENSTQMHDNSTELMELRCRQKTVMHSQNNQFLTSEVTQRSVSKQPKQANEPSLQRIDEICAVLASWNASETAENGEATRLQAPQTTGSTMIPGLSVIIMFDHGC